MVIPGKWTSVDSHWNFVIDKKKMSRNVSVRAGMTLVELQKNVAKEFFTFTGSYSFTSLELLVSEF